MANPKEVKGRITSIVSTQQITKAMKMVAASKLRKAQDRIIQMRPYSHKLSQIIQNVSASVESSNVNNPYASDRSAKSVLLVVVASDKGLCGAFNSSVLKYTGNLIAKNHKYAQDNGALEILPIGRKAYEYFKKRKYLIHDKYYRLLENLNFDNAREAAEFVMGSFVDGRYDKVEIIYNEFRNIAIQIVRNEQFLPFKKEVAGGPSEYIYEPSEKFIFNDLVPKALKIQFYKALLESNAAEHGARMTAMDKATENADELLKELRLTYNRTRQAAITKEILEIVGGAEALVAK